MNEQTFPDADSLALGAACIIAGAARNAIDERGSFLLALSGGSTPRRMMRALAAEDIPWEHVHLFQVDERAAPYGHPDRNLTHLFESLIAQIPAAFAGLHCMNVHGPDLECGANEYSHALQAQAGIPPVLDLIHLGLGADGHTASLVPGDAALSVEDRDVAVTGVYQGYPRLTLTFPILNRARALVWVVAGTEKGPALASLRRGDPSIPASSVRRDDCLILSDHAAHQASLAQSLNSHDTNN